MLKVFILLFSGLIISLVLVDKVNSSESLMVNPSSLSLSIPSGRLATSYIEVTNLSDSHILVKSYFPDWVVLSPSEFELLAGEKRRVLVILFVRRGEEPQREGEIVFKTEDESEQVKVDVYILDPMGRREEGEGREKKVKALKPLYEYLNKNLKEEIERGEIQLAWVGDKLSITIIGAITFDPSKIYIKGKGLIETLEKIGIVFGEKTGSHRRIEVKGYTIESHLRDKFPSNWELLPDRTGNGKIRIIISSLSEEGKREEVK